MAHSANSQAFIQERIRHVYRRQRAAPLPSRTAKSRSAIASLDAAQALQVLRRMSQNTGVQMRVVAEQIINRNVPVEALRGLEEDVLGFG